MIRFRFLASILWSVLVLPAAAAGATLNFFAAASLRRAALAATFVAYVLSPAGQALLRQRGFPAPEASTIPAAAR